MTEKKKSDELNQQELDQVTGGTGFAKFDGVDGETTGEAITVKDPFLSSGHTTGSNITKSGGGNDI